MVAVRLSDVAPNDEATRITYGVLNLTHRDSHEHPTPLEPGRRYRVRVVLNDIAQAFPAGHRFRLSISTSYWPLAWPSPEPARLTLYGGGSYLTLPVRPHRPEDQSLRSLGEPEGLPAIPVTLLQPEHHSWTVTRDLATNLSTLDVTEDAGAYRLEDNGMEQAHRATERYSYARNDYTTVRGETQHTWVYRRGDWSVTTVTRTVLSSDAGNFFLRAELDAWEGDDRVFSHNWSRKIPRNLV